MNLKNKKINELTKMCKSLNIEPKKTKKDCIEAVSTEIKRREDISNKIAKKYLPVKQLGNKGKEARTFLAVDRRNKKKEYAMKTYRKNKSLRELQKQIDFQQIASKAGISPTIYDYDINNRMVIMEKLDEDLVDIINRQKGKLTVKQQKEIINIFKVLDKIGIFHGDANLLNFMKRDGILYVIDFGFSEPINRRNINKYESKTPNLDFMPIAFLVQAKRIYPDSTFDYIQSFVKKENADKITLKPI